MYENNCPECNCEVEEIQKMELPKETNKLFLKS